MSVLNDKSRDVTEVSSSMENVDYAGMTASQVKVM
jgi:hypothetical protein